MTQDTVTLLLSTFGGVIIGFILNLISGAFTNRSKVKIQYNSLEMGAYHKGIKRYISDLEDADLYIWKTTIIASNLGNKSTAIIDIFVDYYEDIKLKHFVQRVYPLEYNLTKYNLAGNSLENFDYTFIVNNEDIGKSSTDDVNGHFVRNYFEYYAVIKVKLINKKTKKIKVDFGGKATAVVELKDYLV